MSRLITEQQKASPQEKTLWRARGCTEVEGLWRGPDGRPLLPPGVRQTAIQEAHGVGHVGVVQMMKNLEHWWHPYLRDMVRHYVSSCEQCNQYNARPTVKPHPGRFPLQTRPAFAEQVGDHKGGEGASKVPTAEWVLLKVLKRKWSEPRWTGPYQVMERTSHAVRVKGKVDTWYHWSQCAAAEAPTRSLEETHRDLCTTEETPAGVEEKPTDQQGAE
ncbi:hypothetical protein NFI96_003917 [Prochilodus magdalenae]|nr:hypothetical protein NFI96_003917 [Prochilodus magdalenae]